MGRIRWTYEVWIARRFLKNMTVGKIAVLSHVTGLTPDAVIALHPSSRRTHDLAA